MNRSITIASIQMFVHKQKKKNMDEAEKYLKRINQLFPQVKLVIFPEFSFIDLDLKMKDQAEQIPGDSTRYFSKLAQEYGVWLIPGTMYERFGDDIYNTALVFSPNGSLVGKYRKRYPWCPYEKTTPGEDPFVFEIKGIGVVGVMICYDLWFPEVARDLTNLGAELILIPTMTTTGDRFQESIIARATAITQQSYVVSCNGVGYGGVGGSMIVDPEGHVLQESGSGPFMQTAIIDFERVKTLREMGVAGVTFPWRDYRKNKQTFSVYKGTTRDN